MNTRLKRLYNDYKELSQVFSNHPYIAIKEAIGNPPERYRIEYKVKGLEQKGEKIIERNNHLVEIVLTLDYPRLEPKCRMLTPVFHPNIAPHKICIADHWTAGESLVDIIVRIGEMICYQTYNIKSPLNGEASKWANENIYRLPVDTANLTLEVWPQEITNIILDKKEEESSKIIVEQKKEREEVICLNCGAKVENTQVKECLNGHFVCSDCIVECQECRKILCVLCSLSKCPICEKIICNDCQNTCLSCNQTICKEHIRKCNVCQNKGCTQCVLLCSECHRIFCKDHIGKIQTTGEDICKKCAVMCDICGDRVLYSQKDLIKCSICNRSTCKNHFNIQQNSCVGCTKMASDRIVITYEELADHKLNDKLSQKPVLNCWKCGYKMENNNVNFCIMCGNKLNY